MNQIADIMGIAARCLLLKTYPSLGWCCWCYESAGDIVDLTEEWLPLYYHPECYLTLINYQKFLVDSVVGKERR